MGHYIFAKGVSINPRKVHAVKDWPVLKTLKQLKTFLSISDCCRRFVNDYGTISKHELLRKGNFQWNEALEMAFTSLKDALIATPVLALLDLQRPFTVETYASNTRIKVVLMQDHHHIAYISKILSQNNQMLSVYGKELLALVHAIDNCNCYLSIHPLL